jgi:hypothetical protein
VTLLILLSNVLARCCGWAAELFLEAQRRLARCEHCGESRYYGPPCMRGGWKQH